MDPYFRQFSNDDGSITFEFNGIKENENDNVNHPSHYQGVGGLEASDVIKEFTADLTGYDAFCAGNAIKYILRWNHKNGKEDLRKAKWYIDELLS